VTHHRVLEANRSRQVDCLISDIGMPVMADVVGLVRRGSIHLDREDWDYSFGVSPVALWI
jgi:hypothetical protein